MNRSGDLAARLGDDFALLESAGGLVDFGGASHSEHVWQESLRKEEFLRQ